MMRVKVNKIVELDEVKHRKGRGRRQRKVYFSILTRWKRGEGGYMKARPWPILNCIPAFPLQL
jgi:hypothetical protein